MKAKMYDNLIIDLSNVNENVLDYVEISYFKTYVSQDCVSGLINVDKCRKLSASFSRPKMITDEFFRIFKNLENLQLLLPNLKMIKSENFSSLKNLTLLEIDKAQVIMHRSSEIQ